MQAADPRAPAGSALMCSVLSLAQVDLPAQGMPCICVSLQESLLSLQRKLRRKARPSLLDTALLLLCILLPERAAGT